MARTHTFQHGEITIEVRCRTGGDELDADVLYTRIAPGASVPTALWHRAQTFARIITQSRIIRGNLGFTLPDAMATAAEHKAAYDALMARDDGLLRKWRAELDAVDAPPGDSDGEAAQSADPKAPAPTPTTGSGESTPAATNAKPKTKASRT